MINTGAALDFSGIDGDFTSFTDALVVPVIDAGECLGTISLYAEKPVEYNQNALKILETVASFLAGPISNIVKDGTSELKGNIDPITNTHRVSYLTTIAPQLITSAAEKRAPISLIYIELKNLGQLIRAFGSGMGNTILKRVADCIKPELRETDILVRYGTQAFLTFLPGVRNDQALRCAHRLKRQIKASDMTLAQGLSIDCQTGLSLYPKDGSNILALLQSAQENLRSENSEKHVLGNKVIDFHRG